MNFDNDKWKEYDWRSIYFLPYIVPVIGSSIVWSWMYEANFGVFNYFLTLFGCDKIQWLQDERFAMPSIILMMTWMSGNLIVIFLAGLQGVPRTYMEAVEVDGGNFWHKFKHSGAINIFLIRQFLLTIPREIDEAAYIDGASHLQILVRISAPMIKPVWITVGLLTFILYWNDVMGPLIYISRNERNTISQALANFRSGFGTDWKAIMAASTMSILPSVLLYFIGQKYFVEGIVLTGLK